MKRALIIIVITVLIILTGLFFWLRYGVGEQQIQSLVSNALGPKYSVDIKSARVFPLQRAVSIGQISISTINDEQIIFQSDTLHISGLSPMIYFGENIMFSRVKIDNFTINWDTSLLSEDDEPTDESSVKKIEIQSLDLTNGTIVMTEDGVENDRINSLNLKTGLYFEFITDNDSMKSNQYNVDVDSLGFLFSEDRYRFSLSDFTFDQQDSLLTLSSLKLTPIGGYFEFMSSLEYKTNMFEVGITNLTADGIDPTAFINQDIIKARTLDFDAFSIHISTNLQLSEKPDKLLPTLLNETIQNLPYAIQLESLFFRNTNIQYSEQHADGVRPGTISFMNSTIQIHDVNSLSPSPANLNAVTYLQNHSALNTKLSFTLDNSPFQMSGSGNMQQFDLKQLNSIVMDLMGMEVMDGFVDNIEFDFEMKADSSSGSMHLVYEDLKVEVVDKDDHEESFIDSIKSLLANEIVLEAHNVADDNNEVRTGEINHTRPPDSPFFQHLWHTLRSGIYDIAIRL